MKNRAVYIVLLLTLMMSVSSLNLISAMGQDTGSTQKDEVADQYLMPLLHALQYGEKDELYPKWVDSDKTKELESLFDTLIGLWDGREAVSAKRTGETKRPAEGKIPSGVFYNYEVTCIHDTAKVEIAISDTDKKIDWVKISVIPRVTGTLSTWRQFNPAQWLVTGIAVVEIVFSIAMAYHCIKRKPRFWGIWLAFILLIYGGIAFSTAGDLTVSFYIYTLAFPKLLNFQGIGIKLYLSLPIGSIVYMAVKVINTGRRKC